MRVLTTKQDLDRQIDALRQEGIATGRNHVDKVMPPTRSGKAQIRTWTRSNGYQVVDGGQVHVEESRHTAKLSEVHFKLSEVHFKLSTPLWGSASPTSLISPRPGQMMGFPGLLRTTPASRKW